MIEAFKQHLANLGDEAVERIDKVASAEHRHIESVRDLTNARDRAFAKKEQLGYRLAQIPAMIGQKSLQELDAEGESLRVSLAEVEEELAEITGELQELTSGKPLLEMEIESASRISATIEEEQTSLRSLRDELTEAVKANLDALTRRSLDAKLHKGDLIRERAERSREAREQRKVEEDRRYVQRLQREGREGRTVGQEIFSPIQGG